MIRADWMPILTSEVISIGHIRLGDGTKMTASYPIEASAVLILVRPPKEG